MSKSKSRFSVSLALPAVVLSATFLLVSIEGSAQDQIQKQANKLPHAVAPAPKGTGQQLTEAEVEKREKSEFKKAVALADQLDCFKLLNVSKHEFDGAHASDKGLQSISDAFKKLNKNFNQIKPTLFSKSGSKAFAHGAADDLAAVGKHETEYQGRAYKELLKRSVCIDLLDNNTDPWGLIAQAKLFNPKSFDSAEKGLLLELKKTGTDIDKKAEEIINNGIENADAPSDPGPGASDKAFGG